MTSRGKRKPRYGFDEIVMPRRLPWTGTRRQADNADQRAKTLRTAQACRMYNDDDDQKYCFSFFIFRRLASEARPYSDLGPAGSARSGAGCRRKLGMNRAVKFICVLLILSASPCRAADLAADQVRAMLDAAGPDHPADLSGKSLEDLDLSNLDFKRANLSRANLFGAKLVGADFSGANASSRRPASARKRTETSRRLPDRCYRLCGRLSPFTVSRPRTLFK